MDSIEERISLQKTGVASKASVADEVPVIGKNTIRGRLDPKYDFPKSAEDDLPLNPEPFPESIRSAEHYQRGRISYSDSIERRR